MRKTVYATVLVVMIVLGMIVPVSTASAATCYGNSCEGRDPQNTSCVNDAYTISRMDAITPAGDWGNLEMRYSPSCYTNWVRFTPWYGIRAFFDQATGGLVGGDPWIQRANGPYVRRTTIRYSGAFGFGQSDWTSMISAYGTTCWGVDVYSTAPSSSGQGDRESQGSSYGPCIS